MRSVFCIAISISLLTTVPATTQTGMTVVPPSRISKAYNDYLDAQEEWQRGSRDLERGLLQRDPKRALEDIRRSEEGAKRSYDLLDEYLQLFAQSLRASLSLSKGRLSSQDRKKERALIEEEMDRVNATERSLRAQATKRPQADPAMESYLQEQNRRELELVSQIRMRLYDKQQVLEAMDRSEHSAPDLTAGTQKILEGVESRQDLASEGRALWEDYHESLRQMVMANQKRAGGSNQQKPNPEKHDDAGKSATGSSKKPPDKKDDWR
jgi:hypothetical protein